MYYYYVTDEFVMTCWGIRRRNFFCWLSKHVKTVKEW